MGKKRLRKRRKWWKASGTGDDARREIGAQRKHSSPWKEKVNGVPTNGQVKRGMWLYHSSKLDVTLKISPSMGTGSFPSKGLETRTESKTLHTFTILEHQGVLGIWLLFQTHNDGNIVTLTAPIYYNGILMVRVAEEHSCKHFHGECYMFLHYSGWFNGSVLFRMKIMGRKTPFAWWLYTQALLESTIKGIINHFYYWLTFSNHSLE